MHREKRKPVEGFTASAKKSLVLIFAVWLLLFPTLSPFEPHHANAHTLLQNIFNLYFFIVNQTLGIIHEAGHGVCYLLPCPEALMVANGTLFQVGFPLLAGYYYKKRGDLFALYIAYFFTGFSLQYTAWYISTAHEGLILPASKSFLGVDGYHDFNYLLDAVGLLPYDSVISGIVRGAAYLLMLSAVVKMFFYAYKGK